MTQSISWRYLRYHNVIVLYYGIRKITIAKRKRAKEINETCRRITVASMKPQSTEQHTSTERKVKMKFAIEKLFQYATTT